jgi:hypothetical protein
MAAKPMKKTLPLCLALAFCSPLIQAKKPSQSVDFSGNWVLDFSQTKNPPPGLQSYSIAVNQDEQHLKVRTSLEGELQPARALSESYPGSGGSPGGSPNGRPSRRGGGMGMPGRVGIGMPGGGMGMPGGGRTGGGGGRSGEDGRSEGIVAAYKLYPQSAVYKLDGSESTAQLGDPEQSSVTSKAEWAKSGAVLKLSLAGNGSSAQKGGKIQLKDQWKLSEDGQSLMVDRAVHSPDGSGNAHLVFHKQTVVPSTSNAAAQNHKD